MHGILNFIEASPCKLTKTQVQQLAASVAEKWGYRPGDDLTEIVKALGGSVEIASWEDVGSTGSIAVYGPGRFTISLSPLSGNRRDRFTISHELGHYVLHSKFGKIAPLMVKRDGDGRVEWEANWFATGFLMPEKEFRKLAKENWSNAYLAVHFDVSEAAVEIRKAALEI